MRAATRAALAAVILVGMAGGLPRQSADARPHESTPGQWRTEECRYQSLQPGLWTPTEERLTAACAVAKWSVPGGLSFFMGVGSCESGWNRFASNGGRYLGLFQHAASAYVGRVRQYDPPSWDRGLSERWPNSRGQIVMTARMVHSTGWGAWSCA